MAASFTYDGAASELFGEDVRILAVTGDTSYPTGGYAVAGDFPQSGLIGLNDGVGTRIALWDDVNKKVKFIVTATGAEVAAATDVSASTVRLLIPAR